MTRLVLNDTQLIELVRETLDQIEKAEEPNKSLFLVSEFARELLRQRVLAKVEFLRLLSARK